jgi:hypothetical protein
LSLVYTLTLHGHKDQIKGEVKGKEGIKIRSFNRFLRYSSHHQAVHPIVYILTKEGPIGIFRHVTKPSSGCI